MNAFAWIAEQRIREAMAEGKFDDLGFQGRRLRIEDDSWLAPELRMAYKILRDAGCLPPEVELRREIATLTDLLRAATDEVTAARLRRDIGSRWLRLRLLTERGRRP